MQNLEEKIENTIKKFDLIEKKDILVLGVSGGPDSISMLKALINLTTKLEFKIVVAHVNHMIRAEASSDEEYVKKFCEKNNIEFYSKSIDVKKIANNKKIGLEEAGRLVRYEYFNEILEKVKGSKIAIAHNRNDRVETIMMNMLRGSGIDGLKGIEPKRGNIIRPLIECERSEIEQYCKENKLEPKIDKTNFDDIYNRNKIRNIVIPYIQKEFNPNFIKTMSRLSDIAIEEDKYIKNQVKEIYQQILVEEKQKQIVLDLKKFNLQEQVIKKRLIRYTIKRVFGSTANIEKIHIDDILKLCGNNIGNKFLTPNKNTKILVKNHQIYIINQT